VGGINDDNSDHSDHSSLQSEVNIEKVDARVDANGDVIDESLRIVNSTNVKVLRDNATDNSHDQRGAMIDSQKLTQERHDIRGCQGAQNSKCHSEGNGEETANNNSGSFQLGGSRDGRDKRAANDKESEYTFEERMQAYFARLACWYLAQQ